MRKTIFFALCVYVLPVFANDLDSDEQRTIHWTVNTPQAATLVAKAFFPDKTIEDQAVETCTVTVQRPRLSMPPIISQDNEVACIMRRGPEAEPLVRKLPNIAIKACGNRFSPKCFSFTGEDAKALFAEIKRLYQEESHEDFIRYRTDPFVYAGSYMLFVQFLLKDIDKNGEERWPLDCTEEYRFLVDEPRPEKPHSVTCDFTYQWRPIPGDVF